MLLELTIRNIALIEQLRLEFHAGFNVLTGETGAGKSIVVDAMNLSLGGRADRELIRTGAERGYAQALFDVRGDGRVAAQLALMGLGAEDGLLTIGRELSGGRNVCRAMGAVVPLAQLRQLAELLVELHGQHEHQELLTPAKHLDFLDNYGGEAHAALLARVKEAHGKYQAARRALEALRGDLSERERKVDTLTRQLEEIDRLRVKAGEDEKLERQFRLMANAEKVATGVERAYHLVYQGGERSPSAQEALRRAAAAIEPLAGLDSRFDELAKRLNELYYAAQEAGYELQDLKEGFDFDPAGFDKVGERLDALEKLKRKYGPTLEDVLAYKEKSERELALIEQGDERLKALEGECAEAKARLIGACDALSEARRGLAESFTEGVLGQLKELGMPKVRFQVRFVPIETGEGRLTARGSDAVEFLISPNPGEPLKPLSGIASGGELSRIMLALKTILADRDQVGTMIFDEIDSGISGRMAQVVGEKMAAIGRTRQVIAVSHLPQIAALADAHYIVEKTVENDRTGSGVRCLTEEGRALELARMVGGAEATESGLAHARSLLEAARETKRRWGAAPDPAQGTL